MLFNQPEFFVLLAAVFAWRAVARSNAWWKGGLLVASLYFYAYWDWRFVFLLAGCTAVHHWAGRELSREGNSPGRRRAAGVAALAVSLGTLGYFKYANFFLDSLRALAEPLGWRLGALEVILPVGISFYTFQAITYTVDVWRGRQAPCRSFADLLLYIAFFPQLVAGPIVRAHDFLPQLERRPSIGLRDLLEGFRLFTFGMFQKVFLADNLAQTVDFTFANQAWLAGSTLWLGLGAYTLQIFCDFAGYSAMAIGTARMLGYHFPTNFDLPYVARSLEEFWRRWHISLSSFLRDYLYIPLGGNRDGLPATLRNLLLTMLLGGLWHGAAWTFVAWGLLHGLALCASRLATPALRRLPWAGTAWSGALGWGWTMAVVAAGWLLFRSPDFGTAAHYAGRMLTLAEGTAWHPPFALGALAAVGLHHAAVLAGRGRWFALPVERVHSATALFIMWGLVLAYHPRGFNPFLYFQF